MTANPQETTYFLDAPGVIALIRNTGGGLKAWEHLDAAQDAFRKIRMALDLQKISKLCSGRVPVRLHPSLYRALKLTYPTDVGRIGTEGQITTDIRTSSMEQFIGILNAYRFLSSLHLRIS